MTTLKKIGKFLSSMQFAILLLVILAGACAASSFITQGLTLESYTALYGDRLAALIVALHLDDAYHSPWIIAVTVFLLGNLLLCNLLRLPSLVSRTLDELDPARWIGKEGSCRGETAEPERVFEKLRFSKPLSGTTEEGVRYLFASKNTLGLWGAWVCHLGIFLLILGFGLGQALQQETVVFGVPGQTVQVGETSLFLTINDFYIERTADESVSQYVADITVRNVENQEVRNAVISVNNPADLFGLRFYQNSTGWAARMNIWKDGEPFQSEVICAGDYLAVADKPELVILLARLYPDYVAVAGSSPVNASNELRNPAFLYMVYYQGELLGMNILMPEEELKIDEYTVTFSDPQAFTLIQVKRDPYTWLALLGGLIVMLGLILAFYLQPARLWALETEEGWVLHGSCPKGGVLFREQFELALKE